MAKMKFFCSIRMLLKLHYKDAYKKHRTYSFSSYAKESIGDNVPDVKMTEPTPLLEKSAMPIPGLKHHQLRVLVFDIPPESQKITEN